MKALRRVLSSAAAETPYVAYDAPRHGRLRTADEYVASLKGRGLRVSELGEWIKEFVDHKILWPSVNAVAETYRLAENAPEVGTAWSSLTSDEFGAFDQATRLLHPIPKPVCVKAGSFEPVSAMGLPIRTGRHYIKAFKGKVGYVTPADLPDRARDDAFVRGAGTDEAGWAFDGEGAARDLCARHGVGASEAESAVRRVSRALESHGVRDVLSRARYDGELELWRERAFAARVGAQGEESLMRGRFDRVVVGRDDLGAIAWCEVIDFKSEADPSGDVRGAAESYRPQMEAYRAALMSMTGVRAEDVRLTLVFVDRGEVVTLGQSSEAAGSEGS